MGFEMTSLLRAALEEENTAIRERVEVAVFYGDRVLIVDGGGWYGFPGGGRDGDKGEVACIKECLEEVAIMLDLDSISETSLIQNHTGREMAVDDDGRWYNGSLTRFYTAQATARNKGLLGRAGDSSKYEFYDREKAIELLSRNTAVDPAVRIKLLNEYWP